MICGLLGLKLRTPWIESLSMVLIIVRSSLLWCLVGAAPADAPCWRLPLKVAAARVSTPDCRVAPPTHFSNLRIRVLEESPVILQHRSLSPFLPPVPQMYAQCTTACVVAPFAFPIFPRASGQKRRENWTDHFCL